MADLNSTIVKGNLRVTADTNVSGKVDATTLSENGTNLENKYVQITVIGDQVTYTYSNGVLTITPKSSS